MEIDLFVGQERSIALRKHKIQASLSSFPNQTKVAAHPIES